jgi:hypothetical protein
MEFFRNKIHERISIKNERVIIFELIYLKVLLMQKIDLHKFNSFIFNSVLNV